MAYSERIGNLHIHTTYSDGTGDAAQIAALAADAGLDFLVITDHNAYHPEQEGWRDGVLVLVGQELHEPAQPHQNHLLALNTGRDLVEVAGEGPQRWLDAVRAAGGVGFVAHPFEHAGAFSGEPEINWVDWQVSGYTGLEIWNYMSEFKSYLHGPLRSLLYVLAPGLAIRGPYRETLDQWDALLAEQRVVAVAGSDAHATLYRLGPIARRVFGYEHLLRAVNLHVWVPAPWQQELEADRAMLYEAIGRGRSFVGYDLLAPTTGFGFSAEDQDALYYPGDELEGYGRVRFTITSPEKARLRLLLNGFCVAECDGSRLEHLSDAPGVYRVEAYRRHALRERGWVYTNPIWVGSAARRQGRQPRLRPVRKESHG